MQSAEADAACFDAVVVQTARVVGVRWLADRWGAVMTVRFRVDPRPPLDWSGSALIGKPDPLRATRNSPLAQHRSAGAGSQWPL